MLAGIALVVLLMFGGGAKLDIVNKSLKSYVESSERAKRAQEIVQKLSEARIATKDRVVAIRADIRALDEKYDATADEYRAHLRRLDKEWHGLQKILLDGRFQLRDLLTEQEWNAVFVRVQQKS